MAGEFGSIVDTALITNTGPLSSPEEVATGVWITSEVYNSSLEIYSYASDNGGDVSGKGHLTVSGAVTGATSVKKISDGVFAVAYRKYGGGWNDYKVATLAVNADASVISVVSNSVLDTGSYASPNGHILCVGTGVYAYLGNTGHTFKLITTNISDDGITISKAALHSSALSTVQDATLYSLADSKYVVFVHERNENYKARTFTISAEGAIAAVETKTLDTSNENAPRRVSACQVDGIVWAAAYAASGNFRLRTLEINDDGTFGDAIDYEDGLFSKDNVYQLLQIPDGAYFISCGDSTGATIETILISDTGTIGSVKDTLVTLSALVTYIEYLAGCVYVGWYQKSNFQSWAFSINISRGVTYVPGARVAGIRHVYRPGSYRLEATFGDVSTTVDVVKQKVILPPPPEKEEAAEARTIEVPQKTAPEVVRAVEAELSRATVIAGPAIPGVIPGVTEDPMKLYEAELRKRSAAERAGLFYMQITGHPTYPQSLWQKLTPWKEEKGETFGSEFMERWRSLTGWVGGLFK